MAKVNCAELSVLVVDDFKLLREHMCQCLAKMGFADIDMATTSAEAEGKMSAKKYDIVFLDWVMPGKSGYAMLQQYRQNRDYDHVAFVMVTNQTDERHMVEATKAGATAYIFKPVLPAQLGPRMEEVLDWVGKVNPRFRKA